MERHIKTILLSIPIKAVPLNDGFMNRAERSVDASCDIGRIKGTPGVVLSLILENTSAKVAYEIELSAIK